MGLYKKALKQSGVPDDVVAREDDTLEEKKQLKSERKKRSSWYKSSWVITTFVGMAFVALGALFLSDNLRDIGLKPPTSVEKELVEKPVTSDRLPPGKSQKEPTEPISSLEKVAVPVAKSTAAEDKEIIDIGAMDQDEADRAKLADDRLQASQVPAPIEKKAVKKTPEKNSPVSQKPPSNRPVPKAMSEKATPGVAKPSSTKVATSAGKPALKPLKTDTVETSKVPLVPKKPKDTLEKVATKDERTSAGEKVVAFKVTDTKTKEQEKSFETHRVGKKIDKPTVSPPVKKEQAEKKVEKDQLASAKAPPEKPKSKEESPKGAVPMAKPPVPVKKTEEPKATKPSLGEQEKANKALLARYGLGDKKVSPPMEKEPAQRTVKKGDVTKEKPRKKQAAAMQASKNMTPSKMEPSSSGQKVLALKTPTPVKQEMGQATETPAKKLKEQQATAKTARFIIQIGAYSKKANAEKLVQALRRRDHQAYIEEKEISSGLLHMVRVKGFENREEAKQVANLLRQQGLKDAYVLR